VTAVAFDPAHDAQVRLDARVTTCAGCDGWAWDGALCGACRKFSGSALLERPSTPPAGRKDFL
jgi:hypothetical protein